MFSQIIQVPQGRFKVLAPELTRTGPYPVALIPGQFQDYYKRYIIQFFWIDSQSVFIYWCAELFLAWMNHCVVHDRYSPNELRYLPLNTALFEPPLDPELPALDSEPDSDDAEDGKEDKKNKNSSVSHLACAAFHRVFFSSLHLHLFAHTWHNAWQWNQKPKDALARFSKRCIRAWETELCHKPNFNHHSDHDTATTAWSILGPMTESYASLRYPHSICNTLCFTLSPSLCYLQDSSSGNTSDVESQDGGGGHGHKSKGKDRTSTPGKDGSQRNPASHKATPGYKVEDKTTWTLLQQQQQHFSTPSSSFYYYHSLTPSIPPPLLSFLHFVLRLIQFVSWDNRV